MFSYVMLEERVPEDHPLRPIHRMAVSVPVRLSARFDELYSQVGRPSIPPEFLPRALDFHAGFGSLQPGSDAEFRVPSMRNPTSWAREGELTHCSSSSSTFLNFFRLAWVALGSQSVQIRGFFNSLLGRHQA